MDKAVADGKRRKDTLDAAAASSSNQPPPPPPDKPKIVQNPVIPMPSSQPSGVAVSGKERAVQSNGGLQIPVNLPPSTNKTREADKPLNKSMREGADPAVRKKAQTGRSRSNYVIDPRIFIQVIYILTTFCFCPISLFFSLN